MFSGCVPCVVSYRMLTICVRVGDTVTPWMEKVFRIPSSSIFVVCEWIPRNIQCTDVCLNKLLYQEVAFPSETSHTIAAFLGDPRICSLLDLNDRSCREILSKSSL